MENGIRNEAVTLSIRPLLDKIAGALSNGIVGFVAIASGMTGNATAADITAHGVTTFKAYAFYAPAALMIFSAIIFAWKITLTEKNMHKSLRNWKTNWLQLIQWKMNFTMQ